jgi:hypothetical protein
MFLRIRISPLLVPILVRRQRLARRELFLNAGLKCFPRKGHVRDRIRRWASVAVCEMNVINANVNDYPNFRRIIDP